MVEVIQPQTGEAVDNPIKGFIKVIDKEGNLVETLIASVEPLMDSLPIEILVSIQDWVWKKHPDCSVAIK